MEIRSIEAIVQALNKRQVKYLVVGGLAVNAHGYERLTRDIDIVIGLEPSNIISGLHALIAIGYVPSIPVTPEEFANPANRDAWRRDKNMLVLKLWSDTHRRTPIDVFVYEPFDFTLEYSLAVRIDVGNGLAAPFVKQDTLIEMKRVAGRPQDIADITALGEVARLRSTYNNE